MSIINDRRVGRFCLGIDQINDSPLACRAIFSSVIVLDATVKLHNNEIEYVALCDKFHVIEVGEAVPVYHASLKVNYDEAGKAASFELVDWMGGL